MRLGLVVQRYGEGVDGGAEAHCKAVAERLAENHQVTVLTTCAKDYLSWADFFPAGESIENGVRLLRFPVAKSRRIRWFNYLAKRIYENPHTIDAEWRWLVRQGPYTPALLAHLEEHEADYDAFIFWTYLYFPTAAGLPLVSHKSILVPTAHDEPPLYLSIFKPLFNLPRAILFNTQAERELVERVFHNQRIPSEVVALGIDPPPPGDAAGFRERHGIDGPMLLYLGRVDVFKGCGEMVEYFQALAARPEYRNLNLVLVGRRHMDIPSHPRIKSLGFVPEQEKADALAAADILVMPSAHESLSMVTMEAGMAGKPVLVNQRCEVLARYIEQSGAGCHYGNADEFEAALKRLLSDPETAAAMGGRGGAFVREHYNWERVLGIYQRALERVAGPETGAR